MATATTNGSKVIKPDHQAGRKHFIFSQEHEDLRESMQSWVKKELWPHRNEWEDTYWDSAAMKRDLIKARLTNLPTRLSAAVWRTS